MISSKWSRVWLTKIENNIIEYVEEILLVSFEMTIGQKITCSENVRGFLIA